MATKGLKMVTLALLDDKGVIVKGETGLSTNGVFPITDAMLMVASRALADCSPMAKEGDGPLLPLLADIQQVSRYIAKQVAKEAQVQGVATVTSDSALEEAIERNYWEPEYRIYKRTSF